MSFTTACPNCGARLQAADTVAGKRVKCKKCGDAFVARPVEDDEDGPSAKAAAKPRPRPVADEEHEDDRPRRPSKAARWHDEQDQDRPFHRSRDEDHEPRKAKEMGKKKKKPAGSPVVLFVLIGVGALVLIGGGIGVYLAFSKEAKPEQLVTKEQASAARAEKASPRGVADEVPGGVELHDTEGRYRVKFPAAPQVDTQPVQTPTGQMQIKEYVALVAGEMFASMHQPVPADRGGLSDEQILDQMVEMAKSQAQGATVTSSNSVTYQSYPGRDLVLNAPGQQGTLILRALVAGDRVIVVMAGGQTATADSPKIKAFFESLKIE